ncbi:MAG: hypothetical protein WBB82_11690 [Limnothrix sp.]
MHIPPVDEWLMVSSGMKKQGRRSPPPCLSFKQNQSMIENLKI